MGRKTLVVSVLAAVFLFCWTGFASETNWVYVGRDANSSWYIDSDTPQRIDSKIRYRQLIVWDTPNPKGIKKVIYQLQAWPTTPRQRQLMETYIYDVNGNEMTRDLEPGEVKTVGPGSLNDKCIDMAMKYAK